MSISYALGIASRQDNSGLYKDVFSRFGTGDFDKLRRMSIEEVDELTAHGRVWYGFASGAYVGTAHIRVSVDRPAEFGGVSVLPEYRSSHLAEDLVACCLSQFILETYAAPVRVIAYVHEENRRVALGLQRIGFEEVGKVTVDPRTTMGFEAMPVSPVDGLIHGVEFEMGNKAKRLALQRFRPLALKHGLGSRFPDEDIEAVTRALTFP